MYYRFKYRPMYYSFKYRPMYYSFKYNPKFLQRLLKNLTNTKYAIDIILLKIFLTLKNTS